MNEEPLNDEEPRGSDGSQQVYPKVRRPFSKLAIELETDDLAQKGVQKMILAEIARLETEVAMLEDYEAKYHDKDKECAVSSVRLKKNTMLEILYTVAIAIGSGLIGWLPSSSTSGGTAAILAMALGLFIFALLAKWKGERNEG